MTDRQTNRRTDICDCRVAFTTENCHFLGLKVDTYLCKGRYTCLYVMVDSVAVCVLERNHGEQLVVVVAGHG